MWYSLDTYLMGIDLTQHLSHTILFIKSSDYTFFKRSYSV